MSINAHPLQWPTQFPRSRGHVRSRFKVSLTTALENVERSLRLFGRDSGKTTSHVVISSNYSLGRSKPADPGVAVWFTWDGLQLCIPVDKYGKIEENLQAIHQIIESRRIELRHGTLQLVRATFTGFTSLPPPRGWREVLGIPQQMIPTRDFVDGQWRKLAREHHPDRGGSTARMAEINQARDQAVKEFGL